MERLEKREITTVIAKHVTDAATYPHTLSRIVDIWLQRRKVRANRERNRLLFVLKSRGTAHSNQVREFVLTGHGVELVDVYVGAAGVLAGSARLAQQATERDELVRQASD